MEGSTVFENMGSIVFYNLYINPDGFLLRRISRGKSVGASI